MASALDYLHHHCESPIIHCDVKPAYILLDDDLCAHVGDFGPAKFLSATEGNSIHAQTSSIGIRETIGFVAPGNYYKLMYSYNFKKFSHTKNQFNWE